jgi:hypothetical protein
MTVFAPTDMGKHGFVLSFQNVRMNAYAPNSSNASDIVLIGNAWQPVFEKNTH